MSKVSSKYGAPMGRGSYHSESEKSYKFRLYEIRIDSGGYDDGGAYWGIGGLSLYCVESTCDEVYYFTRAYDRKAAKDKVKNEYPKAKFFR